MKPVLRGLAKDIEDVTGRMGEGEAATPAEEVMNITAANAAEAREGANGGVDTNIDETAPPPTVTAPSPQHQADANPWQGLTQIGMQFIGALAAANNPGAEAHPWIERDPATGTQNLKIPLPPPEVAQQLATALSALADTLRGKKA